MFRRIFGSAVAAALVAGLVSALLQYLITTPLILEAEAFEGPLAVESHGHGEHDHGPGHGEFTGDLERVMLSSLATVLIAFGWALVLVALMAMRGGPLDGKAGLVWGAAGFVAAALAPSFGLPPELPGAMAAELGARQMWWVLTVLMTGAGLWCLLLTEAPLLRVAGLVLVVFPHLLGAPRPETFGGSAPPELAAHFATASLTVALVFWLVLGWTAGTSMQRTSSA